MIKYSYKQKPAIENYWEYCHKHQIPHIEISANSHGYMNLSCDLLPCLQFSNLNVDINDKINKIYFAYVEFFNIAKSRISMVGGGNSFGIVVKKKHAEFIASQLFDYSLKFVQKNSTSIDRAK